MATVPQTFPLLAPTPLRLVSTGHTRKRFTSAMMAESESIESPRKKIKLSSQVDGSDDSTPAMPPSNPIDLQSQKELDVGITSFVSPHSPGFYGILKKRYTDFLVNEILPNGEVLHLRSTKPPRQNDARSDDQRGPAVQNGSAQTTAGLEVEHSDRRSDPATGAASSTLIVSEQNAIGVSNTEVRC